MAMLYQFLNWPPLVIVASCFLLSFLPFAAFVWLAVRSPLARPLQGFHGVEPALIGAVGLLFGLFSAFLANDIWSRYQTAQQAVVLEADAIRNLARLTEGLDAPKGEAMKTTLSAYIRAVVEKDWPKMSEGGKSKEILPRVKEISTLIVSGEVAKAVTAPVQAKLLEAFTSLREHRQVRTLLAEQRKFSVKWYAFFIFGILTQLAFVITHLNKPKAMVLAGSVFTLTFAAALSILVLHDFPFSAMNPISAEPLEKAMESLYRVGG